MMNVNSTNFPKTSINPAPMSAGQEPRNFGNKVLVKDNKTMTEPKSDMKFTSADLKKELEMPNGKVKSYQ